MLLYQPLDPDAHQIRLLRLHPHQDLNDGILSCELEIYSRATCPPYVALSYAWGKVENVGLIRIGNIAYQISETVQQALEELARRGTYLHVWVDQICINQKDTEEKTHQVLQMRHIYSDASCAICWLGEAFKDSDVLFTHLQRLGNGYMNKDWDGLLVLHSDKVHLQTLAAAYDLFCQREYWTRLWIIQEFCVASDVIVLCGRSSISFQTLEAANDAVTEVSRENEKQPTKTKGLLCEQLRSTFLPVSLSFMENVLTRRYKFRNRDYGGEHFFRVITSSLALEVDYNYPIATDPRDRVFSLLYLATDSHELENLLDYSKTCEEAYQDTALALLRQGHIDVLSYCQFPKTIPNLPTWVPDWNMPIRNPCNQPPWFSKFSASGNEASQQEVTEERGRLHIKGVAIDHIIKYGEIWDPCWDQPLDRTDALAFIDDILELCKQSPRVRAGEELLDAIRIAASDGSRYGKEDVSGDLIVNYIGGFMWAYNSLKAREDVEGAGNYWFAEALFYLHSRRPFLTSTGILGLGPMHMERADEVCIFYGAKTPYIVRVEDDGTFSLVGEAFVYGMMHGEALRGEVESKTYILK